ncbi:uncharacterized protein METZ01_LOCUS319667, partial [marine metagenome]
MLTLVVSTADSSATVAAYGINLIDEDDAGRAGLSLLEEISNTRRTNADKHLHKVGTADREEWHTRLSCHSSCQMRLARTRRPNQEDTLGRSTSKT